VGLEGNFSRFGVRTLGLVFVVNEYYYMYIVLHGSLNLSKLPPTAFLVCDFRQNDRERVGWKRCTKAICGDGKKGHKRRNDSNYGYETVILY